MNSLEWRVKKLEDKLLGLHPWSRFDPPNSQSSIHELLSSVAKHYRNCIDHYPKIAEFQEKYKNLDQNPEAQDTDAKIELVLAYEDDLLKYFEDLKQIGEDADKVLKVESWPDFSRMQEKVDKLKTVTEEQLVQSRAIDKKTTALIEIYNDIISSFKSNMSVWNQKLDTYENEDKKEEEGE